MLRSTLIRTLVPAGIGLLLLIVSSLFLMHRFRIHIYRTLKLHPFDRDECVGEDMVYDVFICFSHEDSKVAREVLDFLETNSLKVCFHQRDFCVGQAIMQNIETAIMHSKRVLCLVSRNFISSAYGLEEFYMALHHHMEIKKQRIVICILEGFHFPPPAANGAISNLTMVADESSLMRPSVSHEGSDTSNSQRACDSITSSGGSETDGDTYGGREDLLRHFLSRYTYVDMNSTLWRDQLLYAMPVSRVGGTGQAATVIS